MVIPQIDVAYYVEIRISVFAWSEIPRFFFWVIRSALKTHHFVLEVNNVVGLFVSQCSVLPVIIQKKQCNLLCFVQVLRPYFVSQSTSLSSLSLS